MAVVESASLGFVAHATGIDVFGYGDDPDEAIRVLKEGIEGICTDRRMADLRSAVQRMLILDLVGEDGSTPD